MNVGGPTEGDAQHGCKNWEHPKSCSAREYCEFCGKSTCTWNFAYHFCRGHL